MTNLDRDKLFSEWKVACMSLEAERFKASVGSQLLKDLFNRWLLKFGSFEGIEQFELLAVSVLSIKSNRPELKKKYTGWADRLRTEFRLLFGSPTIVEDVEIKKNRREYAEFVVGLPYLSYSALIDAWVRHHYKPILENRHKNDRTGRAAENIELELQQLILRGHIFGSDIFEAYGSQVGELGTYDHVYMEDWYKKYESTLPGAYAEPQWFKICRERFPDIFRSNDEGEQDE